MSKVRSKKCTPKRIQPENDWPECTTSCALWFTTINFSIEMQNRPSESLTPLLSLDLSFYLFQFILLASITKMTIRNITRNSWFRHFSRNMSILKCWFFFLFFLIYLSSMGGRQNLSIGFSYSSVLHIMTHMKINWVTIWVPRKLYFVILNSVYKTEN